MFNQTEKDLRDMITSATGDAGESARMFDLAEYLSDAGKLSSTPLRA